MNEYELTFIIRADAEEERQTEIKERIQQHVVERGGEMAGMRDWGQRRLAYPIRKQTSGNYVSMRFRLPPTETEGLQRALRLNEDILRYLLLSASEVPAPES